MKWKNLLLAALTTLICLSLITACSNPSSAGQTSSDGQSEKAISEPGTSAIENGRYKEPITIHIVRAIGAADKFRNGENISNNPHIQWVKDTFNIDLKYVWTADTSAFDTKMRLSMSANEDMPDIIQCGCKQDTIDALIDSGKFIEVDKLFDTYASEKYKQAMAEDPTVWNLFKRNGKAYAVPILDYANNSDSVLWIRDDWMKKLNLQPPKTIEEMEKMMDAFVNQDPDGNGKKDTFGLALGFKDGFNTNGLADSNFLFGAYGVMPVQWNLNKQGQLEYGSIQPENKTVLAKLKEWMVKGYIHKEAGLQTGIKASELFTSGKAGIIAAPYWAAGWPFPAITEADPNADYNAYPLPAGPDGKIGRSTAAPLGGAILINKDFKHPEAFFKYTNYLYEYEANPQPGSPLEFGFKKGYDYLMKDGEPVWDATKFPKDQPFIDMKKYTLLNNGARIPSLVMKTMDDLHNGKAPETAFEKISAGDVFKNIQSGSVNYQQKEYAMKNYFNGSPTKTMRTRWDFLTKMETETFNKIIYGDAPIDDFDKFVEKWKASSGEQITKEVNEWYQTVK